MQCSRTQELTHRKQNIFTVSEYLNTTTLQSKSMRMSVQNFKIFKTK